MHKTMAQNSISRFLRHGFVYQVDFFGSIKKLDSTMVLSN